MTLDGHKGAKEGWHKQGSSSMQSSALLNGSSFLQGSSSMTFFDNKGSLNNRAAAVRSSGIGGGVYQATDLDEILWDDNPKRIKVAQIICSKPCKLVMTLAIFFSIGLAVHETNLGALDEEPAAWFDISMNMLTGVYSWEIVARLYVSGPRFFIEILNWFDFLLVLVDIVMFFLESVTGGAPNLFALRLVRLVRTLRIIRILTFVRPLYLILHGFISAMQAIFWATTLLILTIMLWSILAVNFLHSVNMELVETKGLHLDCEQCQRAFQSVSHACLFFAESTIAGETFGDVSIPIIQERPLSLILFLGVHITIQLGIMNLILAVIVDQAQVARSEDAEQALVDKEAQQMKAKDILFKLCVQMDSDFSGSLTLEELLNGVDTLPEFMNQMRLMDISREDMEVVFSILDLDKSGDVNYREFVEELYKLKARDSHTLLIFIKHYVLELREAVSRQVNLLRDYVETDNFNIHQDLTSIYNYLVGEHEDNADGNAQDANAQPRTMSRPTYHAHRRNDSDNDLAGMEESHALDEDEDEEDESPMAEIGSLRRGEAHAAAALRATTGMRATGIATGMRATGIAFTGSTSEYQLPRESWRNEEAITGSASVVETSAFALAFSSKKRLTDDMRNSRDNKRDLSLIAAAADAVDEKDLSVIAEVGDAVDDEETKVYGRGLSDGGEPQAGTMQSPSDMALYDAPDMALWDMRRERGAPSAKQKTHL